MERSLWSGFWLVTLVGLSACQASAQVGAQVGVGGEEETESGPPSEERSITVESFSQIKCNHSRTLLAAGTYRGDLVVGGNHCVVEGAGVGQTIIEGALVLSGNHNTVRGLTVSQPSRISGNHNDATGASFRAGVSSGGNHNTP